MSLIKVSAITRSNVTSSTSDNKTNPVVLMVEDHQDARPELKQVLKQKGYRVIDTDNGLDAARQAYQIHPDLLVVDIDVPLLYGLVAARQIIKNARMGAIPAVVVTHEEVLDRAPLIEIGSNRDEYLTRVSNYAELQPLLDYLLPILPGADDAAPRAESEPIVALPPVLFD